MENEQDNIKNNLNLINNNQNNTDFSQIQQNFNDKNNILQIQRQNNNNSMNRFHQNFNNNNIRNNYNYFDIQALYEKNQLFNNINKQDTYNKYNNNLTQFPNNYFSNENQVEINKNICMNQNNSKRANFLPKNLIINSNQQKSKIYNQMYNQNLNNNDLNQLINQGNSFKNQFNNNCIPDNEIDKNYRNIIKEISKDENKNKNDLTSNKVFKAYTHIFDAKIEEVVDFFTDENVFNNTILSELIDNIKFPKTNFTKSGNDLVYIRWKKFYNIKLLCSDRYWSKTHVRYSLTTIEMNPANIGSLKVTFKYYYNTCQNNTLFVIEYMIDKGILSEVFKEEFLDLDMQKMCQCCEDFICQRKKETIHISSLLINTSKEKAWNSITNLNKKRYINYMNIYDLFYLTKEEAEIMKSENNKEVDLSIKDYKNEKNYHIQKGDCIMIKKNNKGILSELVIDNIIEEKNKNEITFICEKSNKESKTDEANNKIDNEDEKTNENIEVLNQKIILSIKEITKDICYLEHKHIWKDWVSINKINTLDFLKINSLKIFKQLLTINADKKQKKDNKNNSVLSLFNLLCPIEL